MDIASVIQSPISPELEDFRQLFERSLSSSNPLLNCVIEHIRQRSGKMMRPILVLPRPSSTAGRAWRLSTRPWRWSCSTTPAWCTTTWSTRVPSVADSFAVNAVFNNKVAVLSGDYLLATALVQVALTRNHDIIDVVSALGRTWPTANCSSSPT